MTKFQNFSTPHSHPQSLDSGCTPEAFAEREVELGTGSITCTDHGTMGACNEIFELAQANKLIPILGLEGYVRDDDCAILKDAGINKDEKGTFSSYNKYYHVTLHARDNTAYEALVRRLSDADYRAEQHGSERKPLFTWAQLEELGQYNLTMTSGCLIGMVQRHLMSDRPDLAVKYYEKLRSIPKPGNFFVEVFPHKCDTNWVSGVFITLEGGEKLKFWKEKKLKTTAGEFTAEELAKLVARGKPVGQLVGVRNYRTWDEREPKTITNCELVEGFLQNECKPWAPDGDLQLGANKFVVALAARYGDKVLISDDSHFAKPEDKIVQDSRLMSAGGTWKFATSYHRLSSQEAFDYFSHSMGIDQKTFEGWINNNQEWAQGFKDFKFVERKSLPTKFYPANTLAHVKTLIDKHGRMDWGNSVWVDRLKSEIELLHNNGTIDLLPYFFLAEEVTYFYEQQKSLTGPGRGSAAGLLLAYLLGITHVDPIRYKLSRERFLTLDRVQSGRLPDVDQDLSDRNLLLGGDVPGYEVELEDGSKITLQTNTKVITPDGEVTVEEAFEKGLDVKWT